jgi:hypothetical protein
VVARPDGVLEQLIGVLLVDLHPQSLDDVPDIVNEDASFGGELLLVDGGVSDAVLEGLVNLDVVGHSAEGG